MDSMLAGMRLQFLRIKRSNPDSSMLNRRRAGKHGLDYSIGGEALYAPAFVAAVAGQLVSSPFHEGC